MTRHGMCGHVGRSRRLRNAALMVCVALLAMPGCVSTQSQARRESTERWNRVRAEVKTKLAADQLSAGHVQDAATELAEAFRLDSSNPQLLTLQARLHLAQGNLAAAQRLLRSAQVQGVARAEIEYLLGVIAEQRLRWDEALNHFVRAANEDPDEVTYVVAMVQNMLQFGEAEEALRLLRSYEDEFGWTGAYHAAVAECCEQLADWAGAASAWQRVANGSDEPGIHERLAMALYRAGKWSEAIDHFEQALEQRQSEPCTSVRLALVDCLLEEGQPAAAHAQLGSILRNDPRSVAALRRVARVFAQQGQFERARQTAEHLLQLAPRGPETLELAAGLALRAGDHARALGLAREIGRDFPDVESPVADHIVARLTATPPAEEN